MDGLPGRGAIVDSTTLRAHQHKTGSRRVVATRSGNRSDDPWRPKRRLGIGAGWSLDPLAIILVRPCRIPGLHYPGDLPVFPGENARRWAMKVRSSVSPDMREVQADQRKGVVRVICEDPRHKQRQG